MHECTHTHTHVRKCCCNGPQHRFTASNWSTKTICSSWGCRETVCREGEENGGGKRMEMEEKEHTRPDDRGSICEFSYNVAEGRQQGKMNLQLVLIKQNTHINTYIKKCRVWVSVWVLWVLSTHTWMWRTQTAWSWMGVVASTLQRQQAGKLNIDWWIN